MTDNSESTFQPHSDEELARLLEEQMRAMRSSAPITAPQPTVSAVLEPKVSPGRSQSSDKEIGHSSSKVLVRTSRETMANQFVSLADELSSALVFEWALPGSNR